ncbi:MAG: hypothetical protein AAF226_11640 [Verrucomicrobiota bacterium]
MPPSLLAHYLLAATSPHISDPSLPEGQPIQLPESYGHQTFAYYQIVVVLGVHAQKPH